MVKSIFLAGLFGALALGALATDFCWATDQPDRSPVAAVEKVAAAAQDAGQKQDWQRYAELVHPEALKDFRGILAPVIEAAQKKGREEQAGLLSCFDGATNLKAVLAWEPKEYFVRFMKKTVPQELPKDKIFSTTAKVLGTILEEPDQAHVVMRVVHKRQKVEIRKVDVVTLKRSGGEWKVMPSEWQQLAESIKLGLSGQAVEKSIEGKPKDVGGGAADDPKKDSDKLQGTWTITSSEDNGDKIANEVGGKVVITADKITLAFGDKEDSIGYKLDPSKSPKWIDLTAGKKTYPGIYELDRDTLKICFPEGGKERASKFESKKDGPNDRLLILKRAK